MITLIEEALKEGMNGVKDDMNLKKVYKKKTSDRDESKANLVWLKQRLWDKSDNW